MPIDELVEPAAGSSNRSERAEAYAKEIAVELRRVARKARVPKPVTSGGGGFQARRSDKLFRALVLGSFTLIFAIPSLLVAIYLFVFAADQYISESRFTVRTGQQSGLEALASLSSLIGGGQSKDGLIIAQYVESRAMLDALSREYDLRKIFSPGTGDYFAELHSDASIEDLLEYWEDQVAISVDRNSGLVTMKVRTFSPEESLAISRSIIANAEVMVNKLTRRNEDDALALAESEVENTRQKLEEQTVSLRDARNAAGILDVESMAKAYTDVVSALRLELSQTEQEIISLTQSVDAGAPQVVTLKNRALALKQKIEQYEQSIAGRNMAGMPFSDKSSTEASLADRAVVLSQRELDLSVAQSEYATALASYERARLTSLRQQSYLIPYVEPRLAEQSLYPKRGVIISVVFVLSFLAWASFVGSAVLVRDHMA